MLHSICQQIYGYVVKQSVIGADSPIYVVIPLLHWIKINDKSVKTIIQEIQENKSSLFKFIITVLYLVGIIGMAIPSVRPYFQFLTPFHLLTGLGVMLLFHHDWNKDFIIFAILAFIIGYGSEVMGVHTGFPFGNYSYGPVLGIKFFEVPLMIGVNWLILVYLTGHLFQKNVSNDLLASLFGALVMVGVDFLIEPVAVALDFWTWEGGIIPLSNYLGWLGTAFIIQMIYRKMQFQKDNKLSLHLLINMVAFFAILNLIL